MKVDFRRLTGSHQRPSGYDVRRIEETRRLFPDGVRRSNGICNSTAAYFKVPRTPSGHRLPPGTGSLPAQAPSRNRLHTGTGDSWPERLSAVRHRKLL